MPDMDWAALGRKPLNYSEVGATAGVLPSGYRHIRRTAALGEGRSCFEDAADRLMHWGVQRGAGLRIQTSSEVAEEGALLTIRLGPVPAYGRVVYTVDEPDRRGFAYGTLRGHPESGEELFAVRYDEGRVYVDVVAFSRPATWWSRLGAIPAAVAQRLVTNRYLTALKNDA
ncbi:uncharacterized protein RMCB_0872 [Mycolicibacterium brisbanense]|uniref:DUF1990 domain-containing protein n=2 Tax=Mycolicibacterium brisbanense TaxID=146020 RepID=A0A100VVD8_9MYCO|nr:uncharacterized protein RMCB_0872 [Mycolicibacterium brisbanense]